MPRPRINNPAGTSLRPNPVIDPTRAAELLAEFLRKLRHIDRSYRQAMTLFGNRSSFNAPLRHLARMVEQKRPLEQGQFRLDLEVELLVEHLARTSARERTGRRNATPSQGDIDRARRMALALLKPRRGRPNSVHVRHHVEGLMALVQEYSGLPVTAQRTLRGEYQPHFEGVSRILPVIFRSIDRSITDVQLANIVLQARRTYAGKPMRFEDFSPATV